MRANLTSMTLSIYLILPPLYGSSSRLSAVSAARTHTRTHTRTHVASQLGCMRLLWSDVATPMPRPVAVLVRRFFPHLEVQVATWRCLPRCVRAIKTALHVTHGGVSRRGGMDGSLLARCM
jgi:hypothetical protein